MTEPNLGIDRVHTPRRLLTHGSQRRCMPKVGLKSCARLGVEKGKENKREENRVEGEGENIKLPSSRDRFLSTRSQATRAPARRFCNLSLSVTREEHDEQLLLNTTPTKRADCQTKGGWSVCWHTADKRRPTKLWITE